MIDLLLLGVLLILMGVGLVVLYSVFGLVVG